MRKIYEVKDFKKYESRARSENSNRKKKEERERGGGEGYSGQVGPVGYRDRVTSIRDTH